MLIAFHGLFAYAEDFSKITPFSATTREKLLEKKWKLSDNAGSPYGWYISEYANPTPEYNIVRYDDGKAIYIRGGFVIDATVTPQDKSHRCVLVECRARAAKNASLVFPMTLMDAQGRNLGLKSAVLNLDSQWKNYRIHIRLPERPDGISTKVTPGFYSPEGAFISSISIRTVPDAPEVKPVPMRSVSIMDFDFQGIGGKKQFTDRTGNFTMFSDCGSFVEENNALRVAFGSRFRIPCKDDAFGDAFTISAWIDKGSKGSIFHTPILARGYQTPTVFLSPLKDEFDFSFYIDIRLPAFATWNSRGLATAGYYYNMNIHYDKPEYLKADNNLPMELNKWQQITAVYDHGATRVYLNGTLIGDNPTKDDRPLLRTGLDLYLGAHRCKDERDNKVSADMLIKSIRIEPTALSTEAIAELYAQEATLFPIGETLPSLAETRAYFPEDMLELDLPMEHRLKSTEAYKNSPPPEDPFKNLPNLKTRLEATTQSLRLFINDQPVAPVNAHGHVTENDHKLAEFVSDFAAAGINLNAAGIPSAWKGIGQYDWSALDHRLELFIKENPKSCIDIAIGVNPPQWYRQQFPEEQEKYYFQGELKTWTGHGSFTGSDKYLEDSLQYVKAAISHIENSPYANHVYGYLLSGGDAGEWYWPGQFSGGYPGYSEPTQRSFRKWLKSTYGSDAALQKAWSRKNITIDSATMPMPDQLFSSENIFFRDPSVAAQAIDSRRFRQHRNVLVVTEYTKAIKELAPGKQLTTYYGYPMLYSGNPALPFSGLQTVGDILNIPYIDWIATPIDYQERRGGQAGANIAGFLGSAKLHSKGIWREEDIRTHLMDRMVAGRTGSLRETNEVLRRAYTYTIADDYGMWYICQHGLHGYHSNGIMDDAAKMKRIADDAARTLRKDVSQVALIFDEKDSMDFLTPLKRGNDFVSACTFDIYRKAHRMGAPFKLYLASDIANPAMPDYKLYIFLNQFSATPEQLAAIHTKLRRNHATALWLYAPGYLDGKQFNLDNMERLTGLSFSEHRETKQFTTAPTGDLKNVPPFTSPALGPFFTANTKDDTAILGTSDNMVTLAATEAHGFRSVWSLLPPSIEMLTALCDLAGVHVYSRDGAMLLANDSYIALHSVAPGPITVKLPNSRSIHECISDKEFPPGDSFTFNAQYKGQTAIFKLK
ncbi:MAG: beta-galactosidase [Victivallales bacterium]|nr:beta-galactosidase [Victivallales bacterium]